MTTDDAGHPRRIEYVPLNDLVAADRNPKAHDGAAIDRSIDRFGFADAAILDERTGRLVAGHGRSESLMRARLQGGDPPDGVVVDDEGRWLVPIQRGWSSSDDDEAEAFVVGHNRTGERGGWDDRELAEILGDLSERDPSLVEAAGYDQLEVERLVSSVLDDAPTVPDAPEEFPSYDEDIPTQFTCPRCRYSWSGKPS